MTQSPPSAGTDLRRLLLQSLASWREAGVLQIPPQQAVDIELPAELEPVAVASSPLPSSAAAPRPAPPASARVAAAPAVPLQAKSMLREPLPPRVADPAAALAQLSKQVSGCPLCSELAATRTQTVFGVGNPQARLVFFGEAPGAEEDAQGEPFVGAAGQLLTKIMEACTLRRDDVYILNTLKCRPPGNRNPTPEEALNCRPYFEQQLEIIQPEFFCCLGLVAAQNVLETKQFMKQLRGRFHNYRGIKVMATYHPAYLLRNPAAKRDVWNDMQMLMQAMGIKLP